MAFSRSARIITLLVIDTLFFFLEIIVGYAVHSLALVADSFHMVCIPPSRCRFGVGLTKHPRVTAERCLFAVGGTMGDQAR